MPSRRTNHTHTIRNHVLPHALFCSTFAEQHKFASSCFVSIRGIYCWIAWNVVYICPNCYLGETEHIRALPKRSLKPAKSAPWATICPRGACRTNKGLQSDTIYLVGLNRCTRLYHRHTILGFKVHAVVENA